MAVRGKCGNGEWIWEKKYLTMVVIFVILLITWRLIAIARGVTAGMALAAPAGLPENDADRLY